MKKKNLITLAVACVMLSSCTQMEEIDPNVSLEYVELDQTSVSLALGESAKLTASANEESVTFTWLNGDSSIISMENKGDYVNIVGLEAGQTTVTAFAGGKMAQCTVVVGGGNGEAEFTFTIADTARNIFVGDSFILSTTVKGRNDAVTFTSSNAAVASVESDSSTSAKVKGLSEGSAVISARLGSKTLACNVTVEDPNSELSIHLNTNTATVEAGGSVALLATTKPEGATVSWQSSNAAVASVNSSGLVSAGNSAGTAVITATVTNEKGQSKTAQCAITVTAKDEDASEYDNQVAAWSKPGHMYFHYLRANKDYDNWALWLWPNYPNDGEGSLWGANADLVKAAKLTGAQTVGYMTKGECGGTGNEVYSDQHGQIIDVDLTVTDVKGGKTGKVSPLIDNDLWEDKLFAKAAIGFLIVDQTKMDGSDMWTSDGGAENYIKKLGSLLPQKKNSYFHVYAVEGSVADFSTSSGKQVTENKTATDTTGAYRSNNDITNLKLDNFKSGVRTSSSFLDDTPGVGYQIFVPSFADSDGDGYGDIQGIISKLGYLDDLGVKVLWLTPIQESNSYHGYDVTDYYKIDQRFGTLEDYQELLFKAHQRGMKVLMDMVINHTSKSNVLYKKSQRAEVEEITLPNGSKKTINYRDMYLWKYKGDKILEWNGKESTVPSDDGKGVKPYGADNPATFIQKNVEDSDDWYRDGTSNYYYYGKFGSGMAELNYSAQVTRDYMTDMCKYWLSFGLDGFRLDAIKHIYLLAELDPTYNYSGDYITYDVGYRTYYNDEMKKEVTVQNDYTYDRDLNVMFWKQFSGTIKAAYPNCFLVGENFDGWNARIAPFYESMDSQFDFSTYYHLNESTIDGGVCAMGGDIAKTLEYNNSYRGNSINGAFTSNHDIPRLMNHAAAKSYATQSVEITSSNATEATARAKWFAAVTLLTPGLSWIYYGDELGMSGNTQDLVAPREGGDPVDDHGNNVDRWYRQPMRWGKEYGKDMVPEYGFGGLEVLWDKYNNSLATADEQKADSNSMFNYFAALGKAKNDSRYPTYGGFTWYGTNGGDTDSLLMQITDGARTVNVLINGHTDQAISVNPMSSQGKAFIAGSPGATASSIPASGFAVFA